ncbi:MAG: 50S ribosomal protein L24 [Firmicutes bacterium ADurb.Bin456]|nr:MAG: 50S ribosomal protein L24 [Firmicutes bacterium ADurb.Bin456]
MAQRKYKAVVNPKVHVRKGDTVLVITGKYAGKRGKVLSVQPDRGRVIVEGVNVVKRHSRPTQSLPQGGIVEKEAPLHSSNVMIYCGKCNTPTRVGKKFLDDGKRVRICKKCGENL